MQLNKQLEEMIKRNRRKSKKRHQNIRDFKSHLGSYDDQQKRFVQERKLRRSAFRQMHYEAKQKERQERVSTNKVSKTSSNKNKRVYQAKTGQYVIKKPSTKTKVKRPSSNNTTKSRVRKTRADKGFKRPKQGIKSQLKVIDSSTLTTYRRLKEEYLEKILNGDKDAAFSEELKKLKEDIDAFKLQFIRSLDENMIAAFKLYLHKAIEHWYRHPEFQQVFEDLDEFLEYIELA